MSEIKKVHEPLFHLTRRASMPSWKSWLIRLAALILGLVFCGLVAFLLIEDLRETPSRIKEFYESFYKGSFALSKSKNPVRKYAKIWTFCKDTAILQCIALAVTPAFRMKFWNIGAEGQTLMGVLGSITVAFYLGDKVPDQMPAWVLLILMLLAALFYSGLWAVIPALFKAKWNTNETLFTLMMNYVAINMVSLFLTFWVPKTSTLSELQVGHLPIIFEQKYLLIVLVVLILTALMFVYLRQSKHGYEITVVGESMRTAQYSGINVKKVIIRTMLVSGLLCGVAGYLIGAGLDHSVNTNSVGGRGFTAIIVSWMAYFNPLMMLFTSALVTVLNLGAAQISTDFSVRGALPDVFIGIVLFFMIGCEFFINYKIALRKKPRISSGKEAQQ